jgi:SNF2 family DNA or RNA helicase
MIRRLKREVLKELPEKQRQVVVVDSPEIQAWVKREDELAQALKLFEDMVRGGEDEYARDARLGEQIIENARRLKLGDADDPDAPCADFLDMDYATSVTGLDEPTVATLFNEIASARRELGLAKLSAVIPWIKNFLDGGEKLVVFAHHTDVLKAMEEALAAYGPILIYGGVHPSKRQARVDRFQDEDDCRLALLQYDSGGVGYTLTAADTVCFAEEDWVPTKMEQAFDRVDRIGQTSSKVLGCFLVANGSLGAKIIQRALEKEEDICAVLDRKPENIRSVTFQ